LPKAFVDQCCTCVAVRCSRATAFFILDLAAMAETSNFGLCMAMATIMHRNAERATAWCQHTMSTGGRGAMAEKNDGGTAVACQNMSMQVEGSLSRGRHSGGGQQPCQEQEGSPPERGQSHKSSKHRCSKHGRRTCRLLSAFYLSDDLLEANFGDLQESVSEGPKAEVTRFCSTAKEPHVCWGQASKADTFACAVFSPSSQVHVSDLGRADVVMVQVIVYLYTDDMCVRLCMRMW
jgi:hypothetical protein